MEHPSRPEEEAPARAKPKFAYLTLPRPVYVLFAVRSINSAGSFVLPFLTMILTRRLGWEASAAGGFISAVTFVGMGWSLVSGKIGDSFGRRRLIVVSQIAAAAILAACALAGMSAIVPWLLAPAIVLLHGTWPVFNALVADVTPRPRRQEAYSLLYWGNNVGFAVGPLVAGYLFERNTALMFGGNAIALFAVSALMIFGLGRGTPAPPKEYETHAADHPPEERAMEGSIFRVLLKRPLAVAYAFTMIVFAFVYQQHLFSLPIRLGTLFGDGGADTYGHLMSINGLTVVALTLPLTRLFKKIPPLYSMAIAAVFYAAGFGLMAFAGVPWAFYGLTMLWTVGEIVAATNDGVFIASQAPSSHRGRFNSVIKSIGTTGVVLAPLASGAFIRHFGDAAVWIAVGILSMAGAAIMLAVARSAKKAK